jgi:hypothetical protein
MIGDINEINSILQANNSNDDNVCVNDFDLGIIPRAIEQIITTANEMKRDGYPNIYFILLWLFFFVQFCKHQMGMEYYIIVSRDLR